MKPTLLSLFAGIGGLDLAAHWAGFETIRFVEKEPFCQKVLAKHWPNVPIDDDVFTCHPGYADVVCGGFPCQPFSVAGSRKGADDERYLLPEMLRIVSEVKPYAVLFENVSGFPSLTDGAEFKFLLGALAEMGFDAQWGHLRASDVGAPHQRERWFCVAYAQQYGNGIGGQRQIDNNQERDSSQIKRGRYDQQFGVIPYGKQLAYTEHNGHAATALRGGHEAAIHNIPQRQDSTGELTGSDHTRTIPGRVMGNATSAGLEGSEWAQLQGRGERLTLNEHGRQIEPGIRRAAHGLPSRLDFVGFPARPGEPQHAYEPSRTAPSTPTTNDRIKALGNAVVPQVAYPIFAAIAEWLQELKLQQAA